MYHILVIDDSEDDAFLILRAITNKIDNLSIKQASSKKELIEILSLKEHFDLIITDRSLPQLYGKEIISMIKESGYQTPIICVSGTALSDLSDDCLESGAIAFLLKDQLDKIAEMAYEILLKK